MFQSIQHIDESEVQQDLQGKFPWLRFSPSIESAYQKHLHHRLARRARPVGWIAIALFLVYAVLDYVLFPEFVSQWTIAIRLFFICPLVLFLIWYSYRDTSPSLFIAVYGFSYFLSGLAMVAIIMSARLQHFYMPYDGLLLMLMFGYFVMGVTFFYVVAASWIVLLLYLIGCLYAGSTQESMTYDSFFLITANVIGGVGSYLQEHSQRTHFLGQLLLEFSHDKAEKESERKTKFIAIAGHELRQPLHAMNLLAENLSEQLKESEPLHVMGRLQRSIKQLQGLLGSMFDISRLSAGVVKPKCGDVDCTPLLSGLVSEYRERCDEVGINIAFESEDMYLASTDLLLLTRILRNILENVIKHSEASRVEVSIEKKDHRIIIVIQDNGIGIDEVECDNVFKEFNSLSRHSGGMGVGLAIVKQLAELLAIDVSLSEAAIGSMINPGCQFTLSLPASEALAASARSAGVIQQHPSDSVNDREQQTVRLMIIDDDHNVLVSMSNVLEGWGYRVDAYGSPEQALNAVLTSRPDIVIADYEYLLAGDTTNGIELIQRLRQKSGRTFPALLLSANTEVDLEAQVDDDVVVAYKPLIPAKLKLLLRYLLQRVEKA